MAKQHLLPVDEKTYEIIKEIARKRREANRSALKPAWTDVGRELLAKALKSYPRDP